MRHVHIHVTGIVQGVGMRPFVYREAVAHGVNGWVLNAGDGVHIEAHAQDEELDGFVAALSAEAPAAARVEYVSVSPLADGSWSRADERGFRIVASDGEGERTTLVSPDIATCDDCLRELFDPADRRFHYPFINCTNCGPRFTIIRSLPYDRAATSMDAFPMCPDCAAEYADPLDRRFHAQPDACFACGPHITWREHGDRSASVGSTREASDAIIEACVTLLSKGGIVAIKGLGGFHLACNACDEAAVQELRQRKRRSNKPLAVMVGDIDEAEALCQVDEKERELLCGSVRPIVLLRRRTSDLRAGAADSAGNVKGSGSIALAPSVAHDLPELGVMLPYTPLQHLLLAAARAHDMHALVMTSGNISEEPIEVDDDHAWEQLVASGIADALLGNNRAILSRYDDSVVRVVDGCVMPVRRARGYAPQPLRLPILAEPAATTPKPLFACGSEQKATVALTREQPDGSALCFLSQHIGDVENGATFDAWNNTRERFEGLFDLTPRAVVCDLHPSYLPSQWGRSTAASNGMPLIEVQHHHAHIASVLAEAAGSGAIALDARVLGVAFDGTGAGTDGAIWGGEFLVATLQGFTRAAHLRTWTLPGGAASVRDARRNAFALLTELGLLDHPAAATLLGRLDEQTRSVTSTMIARDINSPRTSSMGRLFDAVAALLGICDKATYEGEPAIALEAAAWRALGRASTPCDADLTSLDALSESWVGSYFRYVHSEIDNRASKTSDGALCSPKSVPQPPTDPECPQESGHLQSNHPDWDPMDMPGKYISELTGQDPSMQDAIFDPKPLIEALLDGLAAKMPADLLALVFHRSIAHDTVRIARAICEREGLDTVALSGGVFMNRMLLMLVTRELEATGLNVLIPRHVPVNDGCIAYGQAAIARARLAATTQNCCFPGVTKQEAVAQL